MPPVCLPNITFPLTQAWNQRCIPFWVSPQGTLFDGEGRNLIVESFDVWSRESCTDLELYDAGDADDQPGFDARSPETSKNMIIELRSDQLNLLMSREQLAVTITAFSVETGEIFDADILVNGPTFNFDDITDPSSCTPSMNRWDLRNMLVHEVGHFIGFDHAPASQGDSTMLDSATACEVKKRDLAPFDLEGLCTVYAAGREPRTCAPPASGYDLGKGEDVFRDQCARARDEGDEDGCACTSSPDRGSFISSLALFACAALVLRSRGQRRSSFTSAARALSFLGLSRSASR
jgi:hypothetical protein